MARRRYGWRDTRIALVCAIASAIAVWLIFSSVPHSVSMLNAERSPNVS
jgi:hypothetical protein